MHSMHTSYSTITLLLQRYYSTVLVSHLREEMEVHAVEGDEAEGELELPQGTVLYNTIQYSTVQY